MRRLPSLEAGLDRLQNRKRRWASSDSEGSGASSVRSEFELVLEDSWGEQVVKYFTSQRYKPVKELGSGVQGTAIRVREQDQFGRFVRDVVVKYSLSTASDDSLQEEAEWLTRLRGCPHICQLIALNAINFDNDEWVDRREAKRRRLDPEIRPVLVMEFIPNGTIDDLVTRVYEREALIPNRILWLILMCRK